MTWWNNLTLKIKNIQSYLKKKSVTSYFTTVSVKLKQTFFYIIIKNMICAQPLKLNVLSIILYGTLTTYFVTRYIRPKKNKIMRKQYFGK
jgi:hypothetical protein